MKHRAIVFTVGQTHKLYFDISDEEADRRFAEARAERVESEILYEAKKGYRVERQVVEFDDYLEIWGGVQDEVNHAIQLAFARMSLDGEGQDGDH